MFTDCKLESVTVTFTVPCCISPAVKFLVKVVVGLLGLLILIVLVTLVQAYIYGATPFCTVTTTAGVVTNPAFTILAVSAVGDKNNLIGLPSCDPELVFTNDPLIIVDAPKYGIAPADLILPAINVKLPVLVINNGS